MKVKVVAKANFWKLKWPPSNYIDDFEKFKIKCEIVNKNIGAFIDTFILKLNGDKEKIENYLSYLQRKGFKITREDKRKILSILCGKSKSFGNYARTLTFLFKIKN